MRFPILDLVTVNKGESGQEEAHAAAGWAGARGVAVKNTMCRQKLCWEAWAALVNHVNAPRLWTSNRGTAKIIKQ